MDTPPTAYGTIYWLNQADYDKAVGQARFEISQHMKIFDKQGYGVFIPGTINALVRICEDFGLRVRGVDHPIYAESERGRLDLQ